MRWDEDAQGTVSASWRSSLVRRAVMSAATRRALRAPSRAGWAGGFGEIARTGIFGLSYLRSGSQRSKPRPRARKRRDLGSGLTIMTAKTHFLPGLASVFAGQVQGRPCPWHPFSPSLSFSWQCRARRPFLKSPLERDPRDRLM